MADDLSCYNKDDDNNKSNNNNNNNNNINNNSKLKRKNKIASRTTSLKLCNTFLRHLKSFDKI